MSLGEVRQDISGAGVTIAHLMILVRAAAWIAEAYVSIAEVRQEEGRYTERFFDGATRNVLMNAVEQAVRGVVRSLLSEPTSYRWRQFRMAFACWSIGQERPTRK